MPGGVGGAQAGVAEADPDGFTHHREVLVIRFAHYLAALGYRLMRPVLQLGVLEGHPEVPGVIKAGYIVQVIVPVGVEAGVAAGPLQFPGGLALRGIGIGVVGDAGGSGCPNSC